MDDLNGSLHYTDCKQNGVIRFQIINLSFTGRKWAVFDGKVAAFFVVNEWLFVARPVSFGQLRRA